VAVDALRDGDSCLIVPHRDAASIIRAVRRLQAEPSLRATIAEGAASAAARFQQANRTQELAEALIALVHQSSRRYPYRNA
jgi:glycosyltransferase involved in cell wall biosynthesis